MSNNEITRLSPRLAAAAEFVRQGALLSDVGTDHAYLPIYLLSQGIISRAIASDVVDGPLEKAREHINSFPSVSGKIELVKADGLRGIEKYSPTDITVCGMGGELIARIISEAPFTKNAGVNLILQPMTHAEDLRYFLCENGYRIIDERIAAEGERSYQIILASYDGVTRTVDELSALFGQLNIARRDKELSAMVARYAEGIKKRIKGLEASGRDFSREKLLLEKLEALLNELK